MVCSLISELAAQNTARGNVQGNLKRNINVLFFIFTHVLLFTRKAGQGTKIQRVKFGEIINYLSQAAVYKECEMCAADAFAIKWIGDAKSSMYGHG